MVATLFNTLVPGLSPRVRGNQQVFAKDQQGRWSIPACAGEPVVQVASPVVAPVYPRVCGGTKAGELSEDPDYGLSPRVRGNPWTPAQ